MSSLSNVLYWVGSKLLEGSIKRMLTGAGLGLFTYAGISKTLDNMISNANHLLDNGDGQILSLIGLTGIDTALSLILSACVIRATLNASSVFVGRLDG